jgi:hypothetical protein
VCSVSEWKLLDLLDERNRVAANQATEAHKKRTGINDQVWTAAIGVNGHRPTRDDPERRRSIPECVTTSAIGCSIRSRSVSIRGRDDARGDCTVRRSHRCHAALIAGIIFLFIAQVTGVTALIHSLTVSALLWVLVAVVAVAERRQHLPQPLRPRLAWMEAMWY